MREMRMCSPTSALICQRFHAVWFVARSPSERKSRRTPAPNVYMPPVLLVSTSASWLSLNDLRLIPEKPPPAFK
jgi:hypothetical protein